jgi:tetratricopeptide (TPR) repeat protein/tRNA A-37 threonylcarbamoyl transferase component Bud32
VTDQLERLRAALAGRYEIQRAIGSGASATVYLAHDVKHEREVALKVLRPELSAALGSERFLREIKITARLNHPNILPLLDSGEAAGSLFFAMPFVEGESLRHRLNRQKRLPLEEAIQITREVADALDYAHERQVIHRDIKPENLLLQAGHAVVTDFGIARAISAAGGDRVTEVGHAVGTPAYMSPEQVTGGDELDARSDVYALGCLCYEMLAGGPPFTGPTVESVIRKHLGADPPDIKETRDEVPDHLAATIRRALAKEPSKRYASTAEFREALTLESTTASQQFTGFVRKLVRRRVPQILLLYAGVAVVVVAGLRYLVGQFVLSPHLPAFGLVALASLLPTVLIITYKRNGPGQRSPWSAIEKLGIPVNVIAAAGLLFVLFGTKDLGAATRTVTLTTEDGERITRVVPKSEFRRRVAVFSFENRTGDPAQDWISHGLSFALQLDLVQDLFLALRSTPNFAERLEKAGFPDGLGMPFALRRQIAEEFRLPYIVAGSFETRGDSLAVTVTLHETDDGKLLHERTVVGRDVFEVVDAMSAQLKRDFDLPAQHLEEVQDQPVRNFLTDSLSAYRAHIEGLYAFTIERDWQRAVGLLEQAVAQDPTYALAHNSLYAVYIYSGESAKAAGALEAAIQHLYRFPERFQYAVKGEYYHTVKQDPDKAVAAFRMGVELAPEDVDARLRLGLVFRVVDRRDSAIAEFERVLEIDPTQYEVLNLLGELYQSNGEFERALDYYDRFARAFPDDAEAIGTVAEFQRLLGNHQGARDTYERALLVEPDDPATLVGLATVATDLGEFATAETLLEGALDASRTAADSADALDGSAAFHQFRGRLEQAIAIHELSFAVHEKFAPPLVSTVRRVRAMDAYAMAGQAERGRRILADAEQRLGSPWNLLVQLGFMELYTELQWPDSALQAAEQFSTFVEQLGFKNLRPALQWTQARAQQQQGRCEQALETFARVLQSEPTRSEAHLHIAQCEHQLARVDRAADHLEKRLRVRPADPRAHYELALLAVDRGDREEALDHLRTALDAWEDADPAFTPAREAREKLAQLEGDAGRVRLELAPPR